MGKLTRLDLVRLAAVAALFQCGCASMDSAEQENKSAPAYVQKQPGIVFKDMTPEEEQELKEFLVEYAENSPSARRVLQGLYDCGAVIEYFEKDVNENQVLDVGLSDKDTLGLNRSAFKGDANSFLTFFDYRNHFSHMEFGRGILFPDTVFHEAEHVLHMNAAYQHGINALSFKSLNDIYIYCTLMEALACRKAAIVCAEYDNGLESFAQAKTLGADAFEKRMMVGDRPIEERWSYEQSAMAHLLLETNALPNQVYFPRNPDWNQVVSILSRGEVTKVSHLPEPSLMFINACILKEMEKHPNAKRIDEFDMSCALNNRSSLWKDELAIKRMIYSVLLETHDACVKTHRVFSSEIQYAFLYWMGWPTATQMDLITAKEKTFNEVQEENFSEFTTEQMFDAAESLIALPEVQSYHLNETENYGRMLHFSRQILLPEKGAILRRSEKTR